MFDFLFYVILSLSLFGSVLVKAVVSQYEISSQVSSFTHNADYSKKDTESFVVQVFESFFNSKFNIFAFINLFFALSCQTIISTIRFFLDGLTANQKSEAKKRFISMILKDLFFPLFFLTRYFLEYSYSTSFMLMFPIPFFIRYLAFLTRSFIDGLSISSKAKERKFHQKLFSFQIGLFTISYALFILFLNYYFYPNKFIDGGNSQNDSNFFRSSLHHSLVSNLSHESKLRQNLQYIVGQIASLKFKSIQKKELDKKMKNQRLNLDQNEEKHIKHDIIEKESNEHNSDEKEFQSKINEESIDKGEIKNENTSQNENHIVNDNTMSTENNKENNDLNSKNENENNETPSKNNSNNDFYSSDEIAYNETKEIRSSIFFFLSFQCILALIDIVYDVIRHIIFVSNFENDGNNEKSIKQNYINDIVHEALKVVCEITFFFMHVSYVVINLNSSMPSFKQISKISKLSKSKINLNISSNSTLKSNITLSETSAIDSIDALSSAASSMLNEGQIPSFQKEIVGIALYTPIFVMRSLILNSFFLASKIISYKKWKRMSNAIKNNLPDAEEEDMKHEMRCIICRLDMCTCKRRTGKKNKNHPNHKRIKRKVKKSKKSNFKEDSTFSDQNNEHLDSFHDNNENDNFVNNINNNNNFDNHENDEEYNNINRDENIDTINNFDNLNTSNLNLSNEDEYEYEYEYDESLTDDENNIEYVIRKGDIKKLPCGHCFHAQCLQNWTQRQMKCPLCQYDMKNILNRTLMLINQIHPDFFRNENNRADIQDIQREIAPNIFVPREFIREAHNIEHDGNDVINLNNNMGHEELNENEQIRALRVLTHTMLILTFVLLVILIALIVTMLLDIIDF